MFTIFTTYRSIVGQAKAKRKYSVARHLYWSSYPCLSGTFVPDLPGLGDQTPLRAYVGASWLAPTVVNPVICQR